MALVECRSLVRAFGKNPPVVDGVELDIEAGEVLGLIGPNGGGKSTLLLLIAGLVTPTSGTATVDGHPSHELAQQTTGSVGLITATPGLYPLLTAAENLAYFGGLNGLSESEVRARALPLLQELGVEDQMDRQVREFSSGMQQKISLTRALLMDPKLLLLDEPTNHLDMEAIEALNKALQAYDGTLIFVSHDRQFVSSLATRIVEIKDHKANDFLGTYDEFLAHQQQLAN